MREAVGRDTTHQIKQPRLKRSPSHTSTIGLRAEMHHDWFVAIEALCIELGLSSQAQSLWISMFP